MLQLLLLVVLVAAFWFGWRQVSRRKTPRSASVARQATSKTFHCVEIRMGSHPCKAVRELGGGRYLSDEAPDLPVPGCTAERCTCSYIHYDDRREDDRRNPYGQYASNPYGQFANQAILGERRSRVERRKSQDGTFKPSIGS